jgi:hypothetical protein
MNDYILQTFGDPADDEVEEEWTAEMEEDDFTGSSTDDR